MRVGGRQQQVNESMRAQKAAHGWDILCLSHLRWDYVYQRPQHLLGRAAREPRVFFFEEPIIEDVAPHLEIVQKLPNLWVAVPHFADGLSQAEMDGLRVG